MSTTQKSASIRTSFFRSVGLKALTDGFKSVKTKISYSPLEEKKVIVSTSRWIALSRTGVHLLPVSISIFLIVFNSIEFPNGPEISSVATFFLQVVAKFHEMTVTGSLSVVVLDAVRYEVLHKGLNLGLLNSSFSVAGLNFLWSQGFLSAFDGKYWVPTRIWIFSVITFCCILVSTVGPASALLLIPSSVWQTSGRTEFYLGGTEDQLWPSRLTIDHTGPNICLDSPPRLLAVCPFGGLQRLADRLQNPVLTGFEIALDDQGVPRTINGHAPAYGLAAHQQASNETWAWAVRGDASLMMNDLGHKYSIAQSFATGRNRHLRDFVNGGHQVSESRIPVGRAVCGPPIEIRNDTRTLPFPILARNHQWRDISFGLDQTWGPVADFQVEDLQKLDRTTEANRARAKWVVLTSEFGAATAGTAFVSYNSTHAVGRGCTIDCRWAVGQTFRERNTLLGAYSSHIGKPVQLSGNTYWPPGYTDFFDPNWLPWYGDTIKVDQAWLDAAFPVYVETSDGHSVNLTTFDTLLQPVVANPSLTMSADPATAWSALLSLEYIAVVTFIDAVARTGWHRSLKADDLTVIDPVLQQGSIDNQKILNGDALFARPANASYSILNVAWHSYGVGWFLQSPGQYVSVVILSIHMFIAIIHSIILVNRGRSTEAWDSISELLVLAWNSMPTRRDEEFKNCSSGINSIKTLQNKVRVVAVAENGTEKRVELVVVDEKGNSKDGRVVEKIESGIEYK